MAKKLKLNPKVSYFLGIYAYNRGKAIGVATTSNEVMTRIVKIAMDEFEIEPNKILVEGEDDEFRAYFYNSKLKKLLENALERKEKTFKYKNDYSASYLAGIFDANGGRDGRGLFVRNIEKRDAQLLELLGFHTVERGSKCYVLNENEFVSFIKKFSERLSG